MFIFEIDFLVLPLLALFICIYGYVKYHKHLLMLLLMLEFLILTLFFFFFLFFFIVDFGLYYLMIFLLLMVCEGALGLSLLVLMVRTHGNDYFNSFSLLC